jgi:hypothetical protein
MAEAGLRREIHNALDAIDRSAPHLPHIVARAVHEHAHDRHRPHRRRLAIVAVLLLGILTSLTLIRLSYEQTHPGVPARNPTARPETAPWAENLTFRGAINAEIHATLSDSRVMVNTCADSVTRQAGDFTVTLYLPSGEGSPMQLALIVYHYNGPGVYTGTAVRVIIQSPQTNPENWANVAEDQVTLTVNADEKSGTVDARLSPFNPNAAPVTVTGSWSCHTKA